ncbi:hypothetical protein [Clostridium sp.]|uniref:hypothetical protein n=1 Tax=Clostridium sp. TaxID=1506 RepID=UPI001A434D33|nr:hypothetical protein [Clostridium sp.]MBK5243246.1 hypothetical protein [Clostridium sp.]
MSYNSNNKFHKRKSCSTPHLKEEIIKKAFVNAFNTLIESKEELIAGYEEIIEKITNFSKQEKEGSKIDEECILLEKSLEKLIAENTRKAMDQDEYNTKYNGLATRYNSLQNRRQEISIDIAKLKGRKNQMNAFIKELVNQDNLLISFDESLWCSTLNAVIIKSDVNVVFQFKDGTELPWNLE